MLEISLEEIYQLNHQKYISKYEELTTIAKGSFGTVKKAKDRETSNIVAVKILNKKNSLLSSYRQLQSEINVLKQSDHPNIVKLYDFFETNNSIYIVMEYIQNGTLEEYMEKHKKITEKNAKKIMYYLLRAVEYLHKLNIVHKDIKPENIMFSNINDFSSLKLIDFGLSTQFSKFKDKSESDLAGTILYMAPEKYFDASYSKEIDVWSIGIIMYMMLNEGKHPFYNKGDSKELFFKKCRKNKIMYYRNISQNARNLIGNLLISQSLRYTAGNALEHCWFGNIRELLKDNEDYDRKGIWKKFVAFNMSIIFVLNCSKKLYSKNSNGKNNNKMHKGLMINVGEGSNGYYNGEGNINNCKEGSIYRCSFNSLCEMKDTINDRKGYRRKKNESYYGMNNYNKNNYNYNNGNAVNRYNQTINLKKIQLNNNINTNINDRLANNNKLTESHLPCNLNIGVSNTNTSSNKNYYFSNNNLIKSMSMSSKEDFFNNTVRPCRKKNIFLKGNSNLVLNTNQNFQSNTSTNYNINTNNNTNSNLLNIPLIEKSTNLNSPISKCKYNYNELMKIINNQNMMKKLNFSPEHTCRKASNIIKRCLSIDYNSSYKYNEMNNANKYGKKMEFKNFNLFKNNRELKKNRLHINYEKVSNKNYDFCTEYNRSQFSNMKSQEKKNKFKCANDNINEFNGMSIKNYSSSCSHFYMGKDYNGKNELQRNVKGGNNKEYLPILKKK